MVSIRDVEEREDGWVDKVLGLGVWVNSWMSWRRYESGSVEEESTGVVHTSTFLMFSLSKAQDYLKTEILRMKDDIRMDEQLPFIFSFLSTAQKPLGLDDKAMKQFIQQSLLFFLLEMKDYGKRTPLACINL